VMAAGEAAVSGIVDPAETSPSGARLAGATGAGLAGASGARLARASDGYGPPWEELERPASLRYGPAWEHLEPAESDGRRR